MFYHCVNRYNMSISGNVPHIQLESSTANVNHNRNNRTSYYYKYLKDPTDPSIIYKFGDKSHLLVSSLLRSLLAENVSKCQRGKSPTVAPAGTLRQLLSMSLWQIVQNEIGGENGRRHPELQTIEARAHFEDVTRFNIIKNISQNIATGLTRALLHESVEASTSVVPGGIAWTQEIFISVWWEWLSMVAAQIGLSFIFLVLVMTQTSRLGVPVVKSSILPAFFAVGLAARTEAKNKRVTVVMDLNDKEQKSAKRTRKREAAPSETYALMGEFQRTGKGKWVMESWYRRR
ncbi:hypothetical protein QBC40DRAFT_18810 [Triangularia verruculosa]|uniref:Uncharacterized protein n=1 Tax=Triangularia verruculosa TaxID=2587418 RepID=A0AAN6X8V7_9PEZI|nr:hypothetical protein QBC40DRAFT_18810 [Triangularia verruculosa]